MNRIKLTVITLALTALTSGVVLAEEKAAEKKASKPYALKTCVVSDEKLGEMGKPYVFQHEGRDVQLCCKSCLKDFKKDPAKYMKKLDEAGKAAKK